MYLWLSKNKKKARKEHITSFGPLDLKLTDYIHVLHSFNTLLCLSEFNFFHLFRNKLAQI